MLVYKSRHKKLNKIFKSEVIAAKGYKALSSGPSKSEAETKKFQRKIKAIFFCFNEI